MFKKLKTVRTSGCIEDHFYALGNHYVRTREDPNSNYLYKPRITLHEVKDPLEKFLFDLIYQRLFK